MMPDQDRLNQRAIKAYLLGDRIGSSLETGSVAPVFQKLESVEIFKKIRGKCQSTDETDLVMMFHQFTQTRSDLGCEKDFLLGWSRYSAHRYRPAKYGNSFSDFFRLVRFLEKDEALDLESLYSVSADRNSMGNGCISLVYPCAHYLVLNGLKLQEIIRFIIDIAKLTHHHPDALGAVAILAHHIMSCLNGSTDVLHPESYSELVVFYPEYRYVQHRWTEFLTQGLSLTPDQFLMRYRENVTALNALFYALYAVRKAENPLHIVEIVAGCSGDVDSVLALALLLGFLRFGEVQFDSFLKNLSGCGIHPHFPDPFTF